jgi:hypothetical protein
MKKFTFYILGILLFSSIFTACKKDENTVKGKITYTEKISGTTKNATNATVYIMVEDNKYVQKTTADANGNFIITPVDDGTYWVEAEYDGTFFTYTGKSDEFTIKGDDIEEVNLNLTNSENCIYGYVYLKDKSTVIKNQEVDLYNAGGDDAIASVKTDDNGYFIFDKLKDGKYDIDADYTDDNDNDYYGSATDISVVGGESKEVDLILTANKKKK